MLVVADARAKPSRPLALRAGTAKAKRNGSRVRAQYRRLAATRGFLGPRAGIHGE